MIWGLSSRWYPTVPPASSALTVYPKKYAHGFVVLCFVVVMQSFIMNSHEVFIHIHQGCFAGTGAIVRLPQCQWSKPDGYGKISQCKTTTKHSKAKTACIFLGIYCNHNPPCSLCQTRDLQFVCTARHHRLLRRRNGRWKYIFVMNNLHNHYKYPLIISLSGVSMDLDEKDRLIVLTWTCYWIMI